MCPAGLRVAGGARAERWKLSLSPSSATRDARPLMPSSCLTAAARQYLLDLLAQLPDPRKRRGRRHWLAGLLAVGIVAVTAGSGSFAAIGQWAADAGAGVLAGLGAVRGPAGESTFRRALALISADVPGQVIGAWLHTRAAQAGGRLVIAVDGKARPRRPERGKEGPAPGRGPGARYRRGPRPGRRGREVQ
jgi:DDE family transposase